MTTYLPPLLATDISAVHKGVRRHAPSSRSCTASAPRPPATSSPPTWLSALTPSPRLRRCPGCLQALVESAPGASGQTARARAPAQCQAASAVPLPPSPPPG
eukprot:4403567-Pleurochrysis_carterae.AAC.1